MMKKIAIAFAALLVAGCAAQQPSRAGHQASASACLRAGVNLCQTAEEIANGLNQRDRGAMINSGVRIDRAVARERSVYVFMTLKGRDMRSLRSALARNPRQRSAFATEVGRRISSENCATPSIARFIAMGGSLGYAFNFEDGQQLFTTIISDCNG